MGEVFLAHDESLDRRVALKLLTGGLAHDEERVRRFRQEALAASSLNHPNIITIHEVGQWDKGGFMATEFIEGSTLRQLMERQAPVRFPRRSTSRCRSRAPSRPRTARASSTATSSPRTSWCARTGW